MVFSFGSSILAIWVDSKSESFGSRCILIGPLRGIDWLSFGMHLHLLDLIGISASTHDCGWEVSAFGQRLPTGLKKMQRAVLVGGRHVRTMAIRVYIGR